MAKMRVGDIVKAKHSWNCWLDGMLVRPEDHFGTTGWVVMFELPDNKTEEFFLPDGDIKAC